MVITHNLSAQNARRMHGIVLDRKAKTTEKLSSGYRINRAADDAAGLAISEKMRSMIRGLNRGSKNTMEGISWIQVADGAMSEVHDMLHRISELAVQAANDTNTDLDRQALNNEIQQIKSEIDRIDQTTQYNTQNVFLQGNVELSVDGYSVDVSVFDATYGPDGLMTYGGFIMDGDRYTWNNISSGMVHADPATGRQTFNQGTYEFTDALGRTFQFEADGGEAVPYITRRFNVVASDAGLSIDNKNFAWSDIKDENGVGLSATNVHSGEFKVNYDTSLQGRTESSTLFITLGATRPVERMQDVIDAINSGNDGIFEYTWIGNVVTSTPQSVDMFTGSPGGSYSRTERIDNDMINNSNCLDASGNANLTYTVRVDKTAKSIYLEGSNGSRIDGSEKSFASMGITSWDSGHDLSGNTEFTYMDPSGKSNVEFKFTLNAASSIDTVYDGLNGVRISASNYSANLSNNVSTSGNAKVSLTGKNIAFSLSNLNAEINMGRDFTRSSYDHQSTNLSYDSTAKKMEFSITDAGGNNAYTFSSGTSGAENSIKNSIINDISTVVANKINGTAADYSGKSANISFSSGASSLSYNYKYGDYLNAVSNAITITENLDANGDVESYSWAFNSSSSSLFAGLSDIGQTVNSTDKNAVSASIAANLQGSLAGSASGYASNAMSDIAAATKYTLHFNDYSTVRFSGNENANHAIASRYQSEMQVTELSKGLHIQHSSMQGDFTWIPQFAINTKILHMSVADVSTAQSAGDTISRCAYAVDYISKKRATLGAVQNRLEHTYNNNENKEENLTAAESRLRDADMAQLSAEYATHNILVQAGEAMMAQANQSKQGILSLLG